MPNFATSKQRFIGGLIDGVITLVITLPMLGISILGNYYFLKVMTYSKEFIVAFNLATFLISVFITWGYHIFFLLRNEATPGKKWAKIKVVKMDGSKLTFKDAFIREIFGKTLSLLVFNLGYFSIMWDKNKQCWHDKIAKTFVVKV